MAASQAPKLVRGVLLLDAPIVGGWRATALGLVKHAQLVGSVSPGAVSRKRRNQWPDQAATMATLAATDKMLEKVEEENMIFPWL